MIRTRESSPSRRIAGLVATTAIALAPLAMAAPALAFEPMEPGPSVETIPTEPPPPAVLPTTTSDEYFDTPRDLSGCPHRTTPPAPVDESEVPEPGTPSPTPPQVQDNPAGGEGFADCATIVPDDFEVPGDVTASAWLVSDLDTGEVVAARDPHGRYRPASIIKTLLASVALDRLDPDTVVTVSPEDLDGAEGSQVGVGPGGEYTVTQLVQGLLMASGNDVATVLAHQMGGVDKTLDAMNAYAAELGGTSTHAATVSGLDGPGMMSSAFDMSLIFRDAMTRPEFAEIVSTHSVGFPGYPAGEDTMPPEPDEAEPWAGPTFLDDGSMINPGFVLGNDNQLLYNYEGAIGGKTGFTNDARHTFIGAAEQDGRRLAVVLLDGTAVPKSPWEQAALLLDQSFASEGTVGQLTSASHSSSDDVEHLAGGPFGSSGSDSDRSTSSSALERYAPWTAVGIAGVVAVVGAVLAFRSGRR